MKTAVEIKEMLDNWGELNKSSQSVLVGAIMRDLIAKEEEHLYREHISGSSFHCCVGVINDTYAVYRADNIIKGEVFYTVVFKDDEGNYYHANSYFSSAEEALLYAMGLRLREDCHYGRLAYRMLIGKVED